MHEVNIIGKVYCACLLLYYMAHAVHYGNCDTVISYLIDAVTPQTTMHNINYICIGVGTDHVTCFASSTIER